MSIDSETIVDLNKELTEHEFQDRLTKLVGERPVKIWLAKSSGGRLDVIFSIGRAQPEPIKHFDNMGGYYLLGEGVPPELLSDIHTLFSWYCRTHKTTTQYVGNLRYRYYWAPHETDRQNLSIHVPLSIPVS